MASLIGYYGCRVFHDLNTSKSSSNLPFLVAYKCNQVRNQQWHPGIQAILPSKCRKIAVKIWVD